MNPGELLVRLFIVALLCARASATAADCGSIRGPAALIQTNAGSADLFVTPFGRDNNPGTPEAPLRTIERAAQMARPGTTVHVGAGTYPAGIRTKVSGTGTARIVFVASTRWRAVLVPPDTSKTGIAWENLGDHVDIDGFEVDGSKYRGGIRWRIGIYNGGSDDAIRNNHVHHVATTIPCTSAGGAGIVVDSFYRGAGSEVVGNRVHDVGRTNCRFIHGIYISTSARVAENVVYRIGEAAIHLWHDAHDVIVSNNTVTSSNTGIVVGGGDFYHTAGPNDRTHVYNNIVYDNQYGIYEYGATGRNNTYRNNLVFQNKGADWRLLNGLVHTETVTADPQFVGYTRTGTPDFRLRASSPALRNGIGSLAQHPDEPKRRPDMASAGCAR
jgi:hypothetical protein